MLNVVESNWRGLHDDRVKKVCQQIFNVVNKIGSKCTLRSSNIQKNAFSYIIKSMWRLEPLFSNILCIMYSRLSHFFFWIRETRIFVVVPSCALINSICGVVVTIQNDGDRAWHE